jgi:uncharacterized protein YegP (UPF0339 family)
MATGYPYYVIEPRSGGWRALFFGANDELVWWTEVYTYRRGAERAVEFNRLHAATAPLKN